MGSYKQSKTRSSLHYVAVTNLPFPVHYEYLNIAFNDTFQCWRNPKYRGRYGFEYPRVSSSYAHLFKKHNIDGTSFLKGMESVWSEKMRKTQRFE